MPGQGKPLKLFGPTAIEVEQLSHEDQAELLKIIYRRLVEQRREQRVEEVETARRAYQAGQVRRGTVDELLAELAE